MDQLTDNDRQRIEQEAANDWPRNGLDSKLDASSFVNSGTFWYCQELEQKVSSLTKLNTDLLAKVSEQEKEITAWKNVSERRAIEPQQLKKELSEQSQRIEALTKENEQLKQMMDVEHCPSLETCCKEATELSRLREEKKELVDILTRIIPLAEDGHALHKRNGVHQEFLSEDVERISIAQSLLSKFEVPNQI